jgi:hypothetical protein
MSLWRREKFPAYDVIVLRFLGFRVRRLVATAAVISGLRYNKTVLCASQTRCRHHANFNRQKVALVPYSRWHGNPMNPPLPEPSARSPVQTMWNEVHRSRDRDVLDRDPELRIDLWTAATIAPTFSVSVHRIFLPRKLGLSWI